MLTAYLQAVLDNKILSRWVHALYGCAYCKLSVTLCGCCRMVLGLGSVA